jgi:hypothetical protein
MEHKIIYRESDGTLIIGTVPIPRAQANAIEYAAIAKSIPIENILAVIPSDEAYEVSKLLRAKF